MKRHVSGWKEEKWYANDMTILSEPVKNVWKKNWKEGMCSDVWKAFSARSHVRHLSHSVILLSLLLPPILSHSAIAGRQAGLL